MNKILGITAILMTAMFAVSVLAVAPITDGTHSVGGNAAFQYCESDQQCIPMTLSLCTKNTGTWQCTNGPTGTLTFDQSGIAGSWHLTTLGLPTLTGSSAYSLIYYPDIANEGGNGAGGIVLATFGPGDVTGLAVNPPGVNLPIPSDWNAAPPANYCGGLDLHGDWYMHCNGAKIWVVPTSDVIGGPNPITSISFANWNSYLYETDLIRYAPPVEPSCNPNTHQCEYVTTCGLSATGNVQFNNVVPGATVPGVGTTLVTNTGTGSITPSISGTIWQGSDSHTMPIGATSWKVGATWNTLLITPGTSMTTLPNTGNTETVSYELTAPTSTIPDTYAQTITFTGTCP